jgi:hypothetical protein
LLVAGLLSSCLSEPDLENIPQETVEFIPVEETDEASIFPLKTASYAEFGILGHGYDVTKDYAIEDGFSNKGQVIDIQKIVNSSQPFLSSGSINRQETIDLVSSDAANYSLQLTLNSGLDGSTPVFGGAILNRFGNKRNAQGEFDGKKIYGTWELSIVYKFSKVLGDFTNDESLTAINIKKDYLSDDFANFIKSNNAQSIVRNFGTHVIRDASFGARLEVNFQAETNEPNRSELAFQKLPLKSYPGANETFNEVYTWRTIGGDTTFAVKGEHYLADGTPPTLSHAKWQSTITEDNCVLLGFFPNGLIPVYYFIQDPIKKAEVKAYVDQYISDNSVKLFNAKTNIHRLHDKKGSNHIFTIDPDKESLKGYDYEGVSFKAFNYLAPGTRPVYRYLNSKSSNHLFTMEPKLPQGFIKDPFIGGDNVFEKIAFYAFESEAPGTKPIFSSKKTKGNNTHQLLTADITEHQNALKNGYADEGIVFYAY